MDKPLRIHKQEDIVWKKEKKVVNTPYCPVCKEKLVELHKEYKPYYCECGVWYWVNDPHTEEKAHYRIFE